MEAETKRKTLANCKLSEFARQANAIRHYAAEYYKLLDIEATKKEILDRFGTDAKASRELVSAIVDKMLDTNAEATVRIIGLAAFLSYDEAEMLSPGEAINIVLECVTSERVADFFINAASWAGMNTADISKMLTSIRLNFSGKDTLPNQSTTSSSNISEN